MSMDCEFLVTPVLVIRERRQKMTWAMLLPRKGTEFPWVAKRAARFIDQFGHNKITLRCDNEPAIVALAREIAQVRQEGSQTVPVKHQCGKPVQWEQSARCGVARAMPTRHLLKNTKACFAPSFAREATVPRRAFQPGTCTRNIFVP